MAKKGNIHINRRLTRALFQSGRKVDGELACSSNPQNEGNVDQRCVKALEARQREPVQLE
jgi:hypothetical protein